MSPRLPPHVAARIDEVVNRRLSAEELAEALSVPMTDDELTERRAQIAWFRRRYPTAGERLAWARRAYARWTAMRASAGDPVDQLP